VFRGSEESIPELVDTRLPYLEERWKAVHVWMVVEPEWIRDKVRFEAQDARASRYEAEDVSIIEGQEVKEWIKLERADGRRRTTRYCPVYPVGGADLPLARPDGLIPGGWRATSIANSAGTILRRATSVMSTGVNIGCAAHAMKNT